MPHFVLLHTTVVMHHRDFDRASEIPATFNAMIFFRFANASGLSARVTYARASVCTCVVALRYAANTLWGSVPSLFCDLIPRHEPRISRDVVVSVGWYFKSRLVNELSPAQKNISRTNISRLNCARDIF